MWHWVRQQLVGTSVLPPPGRPRAASAARVAGKGRRRGRRARPQQSRAPGSEPAKPRAAPGRRGWRREAAASSPRVSATPTSRVLGGCGQKRGSGAGSAFPPRKRGERKSLAFPASGSLGQVYGKGEEGLSLAPCRQC